MIPQNTDYSIFSYNKRIPVVGINDRSASFQASLLPDYYKTSSASRDMGWVIKNDSALVEFWRTRGDTVLHLLTELSGIPWFERKFDIYLVRHYTSIGSGDPTIIPLNGIYNKGLIESVPTDHRLLLNLIYQLSHRMLAQTVRPNDSIYLSIASHPVMRPGPLRRDVIALHLAITVAQNIIGLDSARMAYDSEFWKRQTPGREVYEQFVQGRWILLPDQSLADWIAGEPYRSEFVLATRPPRLPRPGTVRSDQRFVEGLPLTGQLGISITIDDRNRLMIDGIDIYRLGYACGLREGDRIRRVDGALVRTHRILVEKTLHGLDQNGSATFEIIRDGVPQLFVIQPLVSRLQLEEEFYEEFDDEPDTLSNDFLYPHEDDY